MPKKKKDAGEKDPPLVEVAIEGGGIELRTVPPRNVAELIEATVSLFEAIAGDAEPEISLVGIREGSCALDFEPKTKAAQMTVAMAHEAVKMRGEGSPPAVRAALRRMKIAGRLGSVRFALNGKFPGKKRYEVLRIAEPIVEKDRECDQTVTLYGRIVGVSHGRDNYSLDVSPDGGKRIEVELPSELVESARNLFDRTVRASAIARIGDLSTAYVATALSEFSEASFLEEMDVIRAELKKEGVFGDPAKLIEELDS